MGQQRIHVSAPSLNLLYSCKRGKIKHSQLLNLLNVGHMAGLNERKLSSLCRIPYKTLITEVKWYLGGDLGLHFLILDLKIFIFIHKFLLNSVRVALVTTSFTHFPVDVFPCVLCS